MIVQYSIQKMVSDGTLSTIALGIQYLQRNDIYIRIAGEETPQSGAPNGYTWSFINNTTLEILPVVPNGIEVVVYRRTDVDAMYNIYSQNAQFDEATIDENNQQLLYIAQEYLEQGIPGAGVDTIEFLRDDGSNTYYRIKRTDGSYSDEFAVPSAASATKILAREALRRSYAEAAYNLVPGSFEAGAVISSINDAVLYENSGAAYSGPVGTIPPGSTPSAGAFVDISSKLLRLVPNKLSTYGGDLQLAIDNSLEVVVDVDYNLNSNVRLRSGTKLIRGGGTITVSSGGMLRTEVTSPVLYYADNIGAPQLPLAVGVSANDSTIRLLDTSTISIGDWLVVKNGYCDMWRVLESGDAAIQRKAVDATVYKTELVRVLNKVGDILTITPLQYDYPATPQTFGFLTDENNLPAYVGYTRPSVTVLKYKDIALDIDLVVDSSVTSPIMHLSYVEGLELKCSGISSANCPVLMRVTSSIVDVQLVDITGHTGSILWVQETSRGTQTKLKAYNWTSGGSDAPFITTIMSDIETTSVDVVAASPYTSTSAVYYNAVAGGIISGVQAKGVARCVDVSFSKGVVGYGVNGVNCDFVYGAFAASSCILSDGTVRGYCVQNITTSSFTSTLITCRDTTNMSYHNITRYGDKGYGRVRVGNCVGLHLSAIYAPATYLHTVIINKTGEPAQGASNAQGSINYCTFGGLVRESTYYDAADEYGYSYPLSKYRGIKITDGGAVSLGGRFNPADEYDILCTTTMQLDGGIFGVSLSGIAAGITVPLSGKPTCFPCIEHLKLFVKPSAGVFQPVDTMMGDGSVWSTSFVNGARISDVYSRKVYTNTSVKGSAPIWTPTV